MEHRAKSAVIIIVIVIAVDRVPRNMVQLIQRRQHGAQAIDDLFKIVRGPVVIIFAGPHDEECAPFCIIR
jgi:uncharacterized membrane protein